jgi:hypothetical protein
LHQAAGGAIERLAVRERRVVELAYHYLEAGEGARALPYVLQSGDRAEAVYAHTEAKQHYRTALDLARELGDLAREAEALEKLGRALAAPGSTSRSADALDANEGAAQAYQAPGDAEGELRILAAMAWESADDTVEQAEAGLARILPRILPRLSALETQVARSGRASRALAAATLQVSVLYVTTGRLEDMIALVERGAQLARAVGDDALLAQAYTNSSCEDGILR